MPVRLGPADSEPSRTANDLKPDSPDPPARSAAEGHRFRRLLILGNGRKEAVPALAERVRHELTTRGAEVAGFDLGGQRSHEGHGGDLAIVLGGDGAILRAAWQLGADQVPVVGVNLGRLGFLADLAVDDLIDSLDAILAGRFAITRHLMLGCRIEDDDGGRECRVLNEVTIHAGPPFRMVEFELTVDDQPMVTIAGDGIILSTPIGSTAHNLAAGGPILDQSLQGVAITPLCPHALGWRPIVESSERVFRLRCPNPAEGTTLIVDGLHRQAMRPDTVVTIRRTRPDFQLVRLAGRSYFQTLREKLLWGASPIPRP